MDANCATPHRRLTPALALPLLLLPLLFLPLSAPAVAQSPITESMTIGVRLVAQGLAAPVYLVSPPDGSRRLFIVDQVGLIRIVDAGGAMLPTPFLDVRAKLVPLNPEGDERGLLGLAFHPDYATNGRFFIYYSAPLRPSAPAGWNTTSTISEYHVSGDANVADAGSERIVLQVDKPQGNHNAGTVAFGPDGLLYISIGDGGGANDVGTGHVEDWYATNAGGNGQDIQANLLGNILRIDVDGSTPYEIPPDNPFAGGAGCADGCDEIFAYGLRNPYRFSFDMAGGHELLVGDAGQGLWEEVSLVRKGDNLGWNVKEASYCFNAEDNEESRPSCPNRVEGSHPDAGARLVRPVVEYANLENPREEGLGAVVIGGNVYRGRDVRQLRGRYIFGDFSHDEEAPDGLLFAATQRRTGLWTMQELSVANFPNRRLGHFVLGFGQDAAGEVYVLTSDTGAPTGSTGRVYRITRPGRGEGPK